MDLRMLYFLIYFAVTHLPSLISLLLTNNYILTLLFIVLHILFIWLPWYTWCFSYSVGSKFT
ncbi:hypothetical protein WN66_06736 [Saccharomyces cerevisiae]|nr:hypothetical protein WN66_06736 [Saccharomyces cerevisiae]